MKLKKVVDFAKKLLGIPKWQGPTIFNFIRSKRLKYGPYFYKKKYNAKEVVSAMKDMGLSKGSNVLIHCSWDEFYNCTSTPEDLINEILSAIGEEGTLCMPAYPFIRNNRTFNVKKTVTKAGILAETFRTYPNVKRSINVSHSICAIGPKADFLLSEHHLGETAWDEKSPYYKLSQINGLVFNLGIGKYWIGAIIHCVESKLRGEVSYFTDMFFKEKTEFFYIDYDGQKKSYWNYDIPHSGKHVRWSGYFRTRRIAKKYLNGKYKKVSNLQIEMYSVSHVVTTLISLGRKGITTYILPLKFGYKFEK